MKLWSILAIVSTVVNGQTAEQAKMMQRFNRNKRFLNKWIDDNVDSRYKRVSWFIIKFAHFAQNWLQFKKLQARKDDYVKRMTWALNSPCSALYVNDEVDQVRETFFFFFWRVTNAQKAISKLA